MVVETLVGPTEQDKHSMKPVWRQESNYVVSPRPDTHPPGPTREEIIKRGIIVDFSGDPRVGSPKDQAGYYLHRLEDAEMMGISVDGLYAGHVRGQAETIIGIRRKVIHFMHEGLISADRKTLEKEQIRARRQMRLWNK